MLTIEEVRRRLQDRMPKKVAQATGINYDTVRRIRDGRTMNPSYETWKALSDYLENT